MNRLKQLLLLFCAAGTLLLEGTVLFSPADRRPPVTAGKEDTGQSAEYRLNGLLVRWDAGRNSICIFSFPRKEAVPLDRFDEAVCRVVLELPENSPIRSFSVRFVDARNEVFQWRVPVSAGPAGVRELRIPMTPKNFFVSFGGDKDGRIDFPIRFVSCTAATEKTGGEASFLLKKVEYDSTLESLLTRVELDLKTGNAPRVLRPGEEDALELRLRNPGDGELACDATVTLRDLSGHAVSGGKSRIVIPAKGMFTLLPKLKPPRFGIWHATVRLESPDGARYAEHTRSLAYLIPAGPAPEREDGFLFGICIPDMSDPEAFAAEAETAALCGATLLRVNFRWRDMERKPGVWDFSRQDRLLGEYAKYNIELQPILSNPPAWSRADGPNSMPDFTAWRDYVKRLFDRYGAHIRYWEIWNEPDLYSFADFDAPDYVKLLGIAREEQQRRIPGSRLLTGGFAAIKEHSGGKTGFQEYVLAQAKGAYDIHAFHGHGSYRGYADQIERLLLPMRARLGISAPWYANETAITALGIGELEQARTLFRKFLLSWSAGSVGYNWYNLRNNGFSANNPEHHYGLVTRDFQPKAAYAVYNTLATLFRGKRFAARLDAPAGIRLLEFAGDGERLVSAWNEAPEETAGGVAVFRTDAAEAEAIDLMGNRTPLPVNDGLLLRRISAIPETLRFRKCRILEYRGNLLAGAAESHLLPGKPAPVTVSAFNPFPRPVVFTLTAAAGDGLSVRPAESVMQLPPGEKKELRIEALSETETGTGTGTGRDPVLKVNASYPGGSAAIGIPLRRAVPLRAEHGPDEWDFILDRRDQVRALFDADPSNLHQLWSGPDDLSARIRLKTEGGILKLEFETTDDKHVQPYRGTRIWEGDSIQFAFAIPEQNGLWVAGAALLADGTPDLWVWEAPKGFSPEKTAAAGKTTIMRQGTRTRYEVEIPLAALGLTPALLEQGFRFNALVNDNDGNGRKGWIQIAEGIAANRSAVLYPVVARPGRNESPPTRR